MRVEPAQTRFRFLSHRSWTGSKNWIGPATLFFFSKFELSRLNPIFFRRIDRRHRGVLAHRNWHIEIAGWHWAGFFTEGLEPVLPQTQATNGNFQNYQKWSRFHGNYQNRRTSIFWLLVLSTKIDSACVQMFRAVSGTNAAGCRRADGGAAVSNTE